MRSFFNSRSHGGTETRRKDKNRMERQRKTEEWRFLCEQLEFGFSVLDVSLCLRGPPCLRENDCWAVPPRLRVLRERNGCVGLSLVPASLD